MRTRYKKTLRTLLAVLFWLALWQLASTLIAKPLLLPSPAEVAARMYALVRTTDFWTYTLLSLSRVSAGIVLAAAAGITLAVLTCRFPLLGALISPVMTVIKSTPVASFVVLVLVWLERDLVPILISGLMVLPVVWANVCAGIRNTGVQFLELARAYCFSPLKTARYIYIPSVLPHFRAACRSAFGFAWKAGIAAEVLTVPRGSIGRMIYESKLYLQTVDLFAWTVTVIILSLLLEKLTLRLIGGGESNA